MKKGKLLPYFFVLMLYVMTDQSFATLKMQVDRDSIASDETITLVISSMDHLSMSPNLTPLKRDFNIVATSQSSQFNVVNGTTQMQAQWQITLLPKHAGEIIIAPIEVGKERTKPQLIHVSPVKSATNIQVTSNNDIFIEASVIPKQAFVQEQLVYTLKLYFSQSIENPYLIAPDLLDARISQNGQDIIYTTIKNGKYYRVLERSYLITPKNTGHHAIAPPMLKGYLESQSSSIDFYGFPNHTLKPIKIMGPTLTIDVKPKPTNFSGPWFPAKKVSLDETWETNPLVFREGEPVTRIIEVTAEGATGEQIPAIAVGTAPDINTYPEQPLRETKTNNQTQLGKLTQKIVYIPTKTGRATLPGIKLRWWNSSSQHQQITSIKSRIINVQPALLKTTINTHMPTPPFSKKMESVKNYMNAQRNSFWPIVAILFILMWLGTIWLWRRQVKFGSIKKNKSTSERQSKLQKKLKMACFDNNPKVARRLLQDWSIIYWQDPSIHSLSDIASRLEKDNAAMLLAQVMQLEAIFYGKNKSLWEGAHFWAAFEHYLESRAHMTNKDDNDPLPSLYCNP